ncbi:deoxycytidylate deaminase isoform X4 [Poecile atricapillus]|uniref:deoxycytidylate deaminase isoform X4 n=1 Tax=Poecile atricapillus TaxID=48891 RepID=UPI0027387981|nr:deoxycytidylate deaminase isoform X4 [Poecile atricapillus]
MSGPQPGQQRNGFSSEASYKKREDYLEWPEYFMAVAFLSAQRSKDPSSQVGACIVNSENKIVGIGYNGMPNGCSDDVLPWTRTGANRLDTKYPYGIKEVIFMSDKYHDTTEMTAARRMFDLAGNSSQSVTRSSLTLIQLTADQVKSFCELCLIKSLEECDYPFLKSC